MASEKDRTLTEEKLKKGKRPSQCDPTQEPQLDVVVLGRKLESMDGHLKAIAGELDDKIDTLETKIDSNVNALKRRNC